MYLILALVIQISLDACFQEDHVSDFISQALAESACGVDS